MNATKIKLKIFLATIPFCLTLIACDNLSTHADATDVKNTKPVNMAIDEEKLIVQGIDTPQDPRTMNINSYSISANSRLLLRFGGLLSGANNILDEQPILLRLQISDTDTSLAIKNLQVCPILKNWMMYASWNHAHPYKNGAWSQPGGDFDSASCLTVLAANDPALANQDEKDFCSDKQAVCFNILSYFKNYIKTRAMDNGLAIINQDPTTAVDVYGKITPEGPVLFWRKLK